MLSVTDVRVNYGAINALRGVSLDIAEGEIVALIGPNGAGKTSLLMAIAGIVPVAGGAIDFAGHVILGRPAERILRLGLSVVPENREIFTKLSVWENLLIGATARSDRAQIARDLDRVTTLFPKLAERRNDPAGLFSGGEQQMLAIARAMMSAPKLLMLDEPSLGLAPIVIDAVYDAIRQLRGGGVTVLLVEQNAERALSVADRAYLIATGQIVFSGTSRDIHSGGNVHEAYFGIRKDRAGQPGEVAK
ncbi:MAG: ABC transporter ATP-binding protein [Parvibaculaceae bacterium]